MSELGDRGPQCLCDPFQKLNLKAIVTFYAEVDELEKMEVPVSLYESVYT